MRKEPSLTFEGALRVLGKYDPEWVGLLDKALGGAVLGAGAAALGPAGLAVVAPLWGWVDQKNEAMGLLRSLVSSLSGRLAGVSGLERRELVAAAHTTIVVAAYFEVFEEAVGRPLVKELAITQRERRVLAGGDAVGWVLSNEVPIPSPTRGFHENLESLRAWFGILDARTVAFLRGLAAWPGGDLDGLPASACGRYESMYVTLAAEVPEFAIWSSLGEHAATRALLTAPTDALRRVEALLGLVARQDVGPDQPTALRRANVGVLDLPVVPTDAERYGTDITFPPVGEVFVNPRYRIAPHVPGCRPADENWWDELPVADDFDVMITSYLLSPDATRVPLLLLGHPGAGKSLLTKVLAARLPAADHTVVRVPLRSVEAEAPILDQVQQALDNATHRRVRWHELTDQSANALRVVILDGLDELLQAAQHDRSAYLREVAEFQRVEALQDRPVAFVVTSRTVVADRVTIPDGVTVVKLEEFDEAQIGTWLDVWRRTNAAAVGDGRVRALTREEALRQPDLAGQPLLLLMLAIYAADPTTPVLEEGTSKSVLYERIFDNFARREVSKRSVPPGDVEAEVEEQVHRLSVAALAMVNRGVQHLREADLQADLEALEVVSRGASGQGKRLLGEFFFVHTAEANLLGDDTAERAYEFLHATFVEYLVARFVVRALRVAADAAYGGKFGAREPDDDLLRAVLSHQVLAVRKSTLGFVGEILSGFRDEQEPVRRLLTELYASYRRRPTSQRYELYSPTPVDHIRRLALYSANLVALGAEVDVAGDPEGWRSTLALWRSGLDVDGLTAMVDFARSKDLSCDPKDYLSMRPRFEHEMAALEGDLQKARLMRFAAFVGGILVIDSPLGAMAALDDVITMAFGFVKNNLRFLVTRDFLGKFDKGGDDPRVSLALAYYQSNLFEAFAEFHDPALYASVRPEARAVFRLVAARFADGGDRKAWWDELARSIPEGADDSGEVAPERLLELFIGPPRKPESHSVNTVDD
ncbi:NACHT domain-containing protein [Saccharothrix sp. Mg75]|uniref:NACHT domain-containing protein n=1 Tax=Saccharothrix sp. Mg75 TaxID=3445357 RepID=UPI003EE83FBF